VMIFCRLHLRELCYNSTPKGKILEYPQPYINIGVLTRSNKGAFTDCRALISLVIPDSVIHIGERAFDGCSRLKDVNISVSTKDIGKNAFTYCDNLQNITIPKKFKWHMGKIFGKSHKNAKVTFI